MKGLKEKMSVIATNSLIPKSDKHPFSSYNITPELLIKAMRVKRMITKLTSLWLLNKFSLSASFEMYGEQYGEYAYLCKGVK